MELRLGLRFFSIFIWLDFGMVNYFGYSFHSAVGRKRLT